MMENTKYEPIPLIDSYVNDKVVFDPVFEVSYMLKDDFTFTEKKILVPAKTISHVIQAIFDLLGTDFEKITSLKILTTSLRLTDHVLKNATHYQTL
jgi:hypothetical protein